MLQHELEAKTNDKQWEKQISEKNNGCLRADWLGFSRTRYLMKLFNFRHLCNSSDQTCPSVFFCIMSHILAVFQLPRGKLVEIDVERINFLCIVSPSMSTLSTTSRWTEGIPFLILTASFHLQFHLLLKDTYFGVLHSLKALVSHNTHHRIIQTNWTKNRTPSMRVGLKSSLFSLFIWIW